MLTDHGVATGLQFQQLNYRLLQRLELSIGALDRGKRRLHPV